jgi:hypothetical protein
VIERETLDQSADLMAGSNPFLVDDLSAGERFSEIAEILAAGLMRLPGRKSSQISPDFGENSVDFSPHRSVHADPPLWSSTHEGNRGGAPTEGGEPQSALEEGESN